LLENVGVVIDITVISLLYKHAMIKNFYFILLFFSIFFTACINPKKQGAVIFSFDDQYVNEWFAYKNLFSTYAINATFFIANPYLLDSECVRKLKILESEGHEIACHGYNHLNSLDYTDSMDIYVEKEIKPAINQLKQQGFNVVSFAYPFGKSSPTIDSVMLTYFSYIRKATYNINDTTIDTYNDIYISSPSTRVTNAMGIDYNYAISLENIEKAIQRAVQNNEILVLYAHSINSSKNDYTIPPDYLEKIFELCNKYHIKSLRMNDISSFSFKNNK